MHAASVETLMQRIDDRIGEGRRRRPGLRRPAGRHAGRRGRASPSSATTRRRAASRRSRAGTLLRGGRLRRAARTSRCARGYSPTHDPADLARLRRRRHHRAHAAARGHPRPLLHRGGGRRCSRRGFGPARSSCSSRRRIRAPPTSCCARSSRRRRPRAPAATSSSATRPSASTPATPTWTFVNTPKVVSGIDAASLPRVEAFYGALVDKVVPVGSTAEAELVKLLENTFRHVNIALVNELAMFAARPRRRHLVGDRRRRPPSRSASCASRPGPGVGGHCLPIDPAYLAWRVERQLGQRFRFVELANDVNSRMPDYVVRAHRRAAQRAVTRGERQRASSLLGPRLQGGHVRLARVTVDSGHRRAAARAGRRRARARPTRPGRRAVRPADPASVDVQRRGARSGRPRGAARRPPRSAVRRHLPRPACSSTPRAACGAQFIRRVPLTTRRFHDSARPHQRAAIDACLV